MKTKPFQIFFLAAWMLGGFEAKAGLSFTIPAPTLPGTGSNCVALCCALTNGCATNRVFLNGIQIAWSNNFAGLLVEDTNVFYSNVPGILEPGEVYQDLLLKVSLDASTPAGDYPATVTLLGGTDIFSTNALARQAFDVQVGLPVLGIRQSGGNLVFNWSSPPGGFHLQTVAGMLSTNWTDITNPAPAGQYQLQLALPPPSSPSYYRLKFP